MVLLYCCASQARLPLTVGPPSRHLRMNCKYCGSTKIITSPRPDVVHGYEYPCSSCGRHNGWAGLPKNKVKNEKRPSFPSPEELKISWCQICREPKTALRELETLHTHHLSGTPTDNTRLNLLVVCTSCHTLIHHEITYRHEHRPRKGVSLA